MKVDYVKMSRLIIVAIIKMKGIDVFIADRGRWWR